MLKNAPIALARLIREVARADFIYLYWPGRLSSVAARLCRVMDKPYGIYFRGEQIPHDPSFPKAFGQARFALTAVNTCTAWRRHCQDAENVTDDTVRPEHVLPPRPRRERSVASALCGRRGSWGCGRPVVPRLAPAIDLAFTLTLVVIVTRGRADASD
jgi:hypothetical protein